MATSETSGKSSPSRSRLIPISTSISDVIVKAISEVNNYGGFLFKEYLVTNVKLLDVNDIIHYFKKKGI